MLQRDVVVEGAKGLDDTERRAILGRNATPAFDTVITRTVRFPETSVAGEPITTWAPKSSGAIAYRALAREFIDRFGA